MYSVPGISYQALRDGSSDSLAAKLRTEVEALHLADIRFQIRFELVERAAASELAVVFR
jgi:hypothetical protein